MTSARLASVATRGYLFSRPEAAILQKRKQWLASEGESTGNGCRAYVPTEKYEACRARSDAMLIYNGSLMMGRRAAFMKRGYY